MSRRSYFVFLCLVVASVLTPFFVSHFSQTRYQVRRQGASRAAKVVLNQQPAARSPAPTLYRLEKETRPSAAGRLCAVNGNFSWTQCLGEERSYSALSEELSIVEVNRLPESRHLPEIGNGHVATVVHSDTIYVNGLYSGTHVSSHRARIPSTAAVRVTVSSEPHVKTKYRMDFGRGVFSDVHNGVHFQAEVRRYAHRDIPALLVTEVVVTETLVPLTLNLSVNQGPPSNDISVQETDYGWFRVLTGQTNDAEYSEVSPTTNITVVYSVVPRVVTVPAAPTAAFHLAFLTSVHPDPDTALEGFHLGVDRMKEGTLFSSHVSAWSALWERGRIVLTGNRSMALITNAAFYYLLSSLPLRNDVKSPFVGLAPGGLAHGAYGQEYQGHVFWDQDTWMFPPLMLLHADVGRVIVGTRLRTHAAAKIHAQSTGYEGARYPWESAYTGLETSPDTNTSLYEQHITGDVAWMMRQYLQLTSDTDFLRKDGGYQVLADIADFWVSRAVWNETRRQFEIREVMGPDEWNFPVNNSAYTNVVAAQSILSALYASNLASDLKPGSIWHIVADQMYVPFDQKLQIHPEFDNFPPGSEIKQADVILLGFPLEWPMSDKTRSNDLDYFAKLIPKGPAMTWGMFAVNWLRLGEETKAKAAFDKGMQNVKGPFKIWTEDADGGGAVNFHTGMGGYLQSLLFGYVGFQVNDTALKLNPRLPPSLTVLDVSGVDYRRHSFDLIYDDLLMNITLTSVHNESHLTLVLINDKNRSVLAPDQIVSVKRQPAVLIT